MPAGPQSPARMPTHRDAFMPIQSDAGRVWRGDWDVLVGEGELGERGAQVPGEVGGEHGGQDVGADAFAEGVADGAQVQVVGLDDAEVPFDVLEVLVGGDDGGGAEGALSDAGADHVDAVEGGLGGDVLLVAVAGEARVGDLGDEVLGHLVLAGDLPGPLPDLPGALAPPGGCRYPDFLQVLFGGSQQRLALAGPFGGQDRVVAADQPLAGVVRVLDLGEIVSAGQGHLQGAVVAGQGRDRGGAQRGDPVHSP